MKGEKIVVPNYVSQTCSCLPARYEDKSVCGTGSRWEPGNEDMWGTISQCESCPYRVDIPSKYNTDDPREIMTRKEISVVELQLAYYTNPREVYE